MKAEIRKEALRARVRLSPVQVRERSGRIARLLLALPDYQAAATVMFYVSRASEVDTRGMIRRALREKERVAVPVTVPAGRRLVPVEIHDLDRDLAPGEGGVLEPSLSTGRALPPGELDLLVLPGLAFDERGNRVGRGRAYFDTFLKEVPPGVPRVALAFETQIIKEVPVDSHDMPVDKIVTEKRVLDCVNSRANAGRGIPD